MENIEQKLESFETEGVRRVKLALTDIDGVLRGKYISYDKFRSVALSTGGFCDCVLGWDINDELYDNTAFTGWHTAFPDAQFKLDLSTERRLPDEGGIPFFLGEFVAADIKGDRALLTLRGLRGALPLERVNGRWYFARME